MKAVKEARKVRQWDNADPKEKVRLARNKMASQIFNVNNYSSLTSFQKEQVDETINGR
jgi:hypothetical protein